MVLVSSNNLDLDDYIVIDDSLFKVTDVKPMAKEGLISWTAYGVFDHNWITHIEYSNSSVEKAEICTKSLPVNEFQEESRECVVKDKKDLRTAYIPLGQLDLEMKSLHRYGAIVWANVTFWRDKGLVNYFSLRPK